MRYGITAAALFTSVALAGVAAVTAASLAYLIVGLIGAAAVTTAMWYTAPTWTECPPKRQDEEADKPQYADRP